MADASGVDVQEIMKWQKAHDIEQIFNAVAGAVAPRSQQGAYMEAASKSFDPMKKLTETAKLRELVLKQKSHQELMSGLDALAAKTGQPREVLEALARTGGLDTALTQFMAPYTLSDNQQRYNGNNQLIAQNMPRKPVSPQWQDGQLVGELAANARYRRYGASWTASRDVAEAFAQSEIRRQSRGGTVVLETLAPPEAIMCARAMHPDHLESNEQEFIVDRWKLGNVQIIARFEPSASSCGIRK